MLTCTTLASGSGGNAALVSCNGTHVLLDAGVSARRLTSGLRSLGVAPEELSAILITHEHHDHIAGLAVLTKRVRAPIVATPATCRRICYKVPFVDDLMREQEAGAGIQLGELWVESFPTPHDAAGSVGYVLCGGGYKMALCTDLGYVTPEVLKAVEGCDLLVCEANHDEDWVRTGPYPYALKQRILGDYGHLSNEAGGELAAYAVERGTRTVVLAHLSQQNNTSAHARQAVCRRLSATGCDPERDIVLDVAPQDRLGTTYQLGTGAAPRPRPCGEAVLC